MSPVAYLSLKSCIPNSLHVGSDSTMPEYYYAPRRSRYDDYLDPIEISVEPKVRTMSLGRDAMNKLQVVKTSKDSLSHQRHSRSGSRHRHYHHSDHRHDHHHHLHDDNHRHHGQRHYHHHSQEHVRRRGHSESPSHRNQDMLKHAAIAAFDTGAIEAFRIRNEPGRWSDGKGARVATAAVGAAAINGLLNSHSGGHNGRHVVESAIGGLVVNRLINGKREELERR